MTVNWMIRTAKNQIFLQTGISEGNQCLFWACTCIDYFLTFQEYSMTCAQSYFVDLLLGLNGGVAKALRKILP